jgi:nucleoside-diphosphate-sugar epimerase
VPLRNFFKNCDILFNCAGEISNPEKMRLLHIDGTLRLINGVYEESVNSKKKIHWIQLSSCGAYGPPAKRDIQENRLITELSKTNPDNEYEKTKTLADELIISSSDNKRLTYTILRPSNVIGVTMTNQSIRKLIKFVNSGYFFFIGKKDAIATYVHVDDVVNAMILIAENPKAKNEIFNLSNDCSWQDFVFEIASTLNVKTLPLRIPVRFIENPLNIVKFFIGRFIHIPLFTIFAYRTNYSATKIESYLNFKFTKPMPRGINDLVEAMKGNKKRMGCYLNLN